MAHEEHVELLIRGARAIAEWRKAHPGVRLDLKEADLRGAHLIGADLSGADLSDARLEGAFLIDARLGLAELSCAHLEGAQLRNVSLEGAILHRAHLEGAKLFAADLRKADFFGANLTSADLSAVDLRGGVLTAVSLDGAELRAADLSEADLRGAMGAVFDSTRLRGADIDPHANDRWSVLRRTYTGPWFALNLMLLGAFAVPYVARVLQWRAVNFAQVAMEQIRAELQAVAEQADALTPDAQQLLATATAALERATPCLTEDCAEWPVWQVLLGLDKGWTFLALTVALIVYNGLRGILTLQIGALREAEDRSGRTPPLGTHHLFKPGYLRFWWMHRVMQGLALVALGSIAWHAWHWLTLPVWLPAG